VPLIDKVVLKIVGVSEEDKTSSRETNQNANANGNANQPNFVVNGVK
jgi:hypothetical protein